MIGGEFELIRKIKSNLLTAPVGLVKGIGEDCAVLEKDADDYNVVSTDSLIEKIHFSLKYFSFIELGKKAMAVNLSDIAAMGAKPRYVFVSLGVPSSVSEQDIHDFYSGMEQVSNEFEAAIVGGDLSSSKEHFFINITVMGVVARKECKLRSGARPGDSIYVSGHLGSAALGLKILQKKKRLGPDFVKALKTPQARVRLGRILASYPEVSAMIDTSDGLVQDLSHMLKASDVSAIVNLEALPHHKDFTATCKKMGVSPRDFLLSGGEDYQLLFTVDPKVEEDLLARTKDFRVPITKVGEILPDEGGARLKIVDANGDTVQFKGKGFDHFRS